MEETTATQIRRATRVRELSKMSRAHLETVRRQVLATNGRRLIWEAGRASKDELISEILHEEFGVSA